MTDKVWHFNNVSEDQIRSATSELPEEHVNFIVDVHNLIVKYQDDIPEEFIGYMIAFLTTATVGRQPDGSYPVVRSMLRDTRNTMQRLALASLDVMGDDLDEEEKELFERLAFS